MSDGFNIKSGLLNVLKNLLHDEGFAHSIIKMLLGDKNAAMAVKYILTDESYENGLNEVVSIHRLTKRTLNESDEPEKKDKSVLGKLSDISTKSLKFQSEVIATTLKKPGAVRALIMLVKSGGANPKAWMMLAPMVIDSAREVMAEQDEEMPAEISESDERTDRQVNIMVGRFQPFTLGHLKCLKSIKNSLGVPTLICVIPGNGDDKHPFMGEVQDEMYERLKKAHPELFADVRYIKNAFMEGWALIAKEEGLEPVSWTCGTDRYEAYRSMTEKYAEKYGLTPDFKVYCLDRADDNISATSVRECLANDDREGFMKQMPDCLHEMYDTMRRAIVGSTQPAQMATISEENKKTQR